MLGLSGVMYNDLMGNIEWFFTLHDKDRDGSLTKDEVLQLSESLLVSGSFALQPNASMTTELGPSSSSDTKLATRI